MDERTIQHNYVMEFLCRREDEGGLGYRNSSSNIVNNGLFIPSELSEFIRKSVPTAWNNILKKYDNDEQVLQNALMEEVRSRMVDAQNVATFLNKNKTITFAGETIPLFYVSGTELKGDEDFKKNIFSAVEESSHKFTLAGKKLCTSIRPDITFFLNGIFIGYMELKCVSMGQNAKDEGRQKVAKDYLSTVKALSQAVKLEPKAIKERKAVLSIYEKAIHLVASDCNETYVLRGISQFFDAAHQEFLSQTGKGIEVLSPAIIDVFKPYPISSMILSEQQRFEEVMRALYSKKMIEKEIRYYNFIEYKYSSKEGIKNRTTNTGRLISPRPKQKFGCDKIINRIVEMLDHEEDPDYYINKLRQELIKLEIPAQKIEEIILKRQQYCNNKYIYSLLMQYAAGFGKSNIIGWTALQLKDFRYKGEYAYDKIMLVVDRLQLRDQLDTMMMNMNIDKSMFIEAVDKDTFIKALDSQKRIIVVNIQKFLDLQMAIAETDTKLKKMRVAFLIDEIHRSNSGDTHQEMIDLFARLQESFSKNGQSITKKNLLIGFTATPSDETLTRFGEFRSATVVPLWVPFDSYTMKEAIADGFILDPTKHIIPYSVPIEWELPEDLIDSDKEDDIKIKQSKEKVYAFEPRMRKISQFIVDRLVSLVYGKIRGEGKAMLAVSSVPNAIKYCEIIREMYAEKCKDPLYAKYKDAPISIVYSDGQKYVPCANLNDNKTESKVIQDFKNAKNGLIIVVDKLQTGFDEPKLHTLFLDKEISDINAIQTISRVNRMCKYKDECHVIDCSWHNVNVKNINQAFRKYCDMVISDFNPEEEAREVAREYKELCSSEPYIQWFFRYQKEKEDTGFAIEMEDGIRQWILTCCAQEDAARQYNEEHDLKPGDANYIPEINIARDIRLLVGHYGSIIESLRDVYVIDPKFTDAVFLTFWQIYCRIYKDVTKKPRNDGSFEYEIIDSSEIPGITLVEDDGEDEPGKDPKKHPRGHSVIVKPKGKSMDEVLAILKRLNEQEGISAQQAQIWLKEIGVMFQWMMQDTTFCAYLLDDHFSDEEKFAQYKKQQGKYKLAKLTSTARPDFVELDRFKKMINDNVEQLYSIFVADLKNVKNNESDFDYDTTDIPVEPEPQQEQTSQEQPSQDQGQNGGFTMDDLIALVKRKLKPEYNEVTLKESIVEKYSVHFEDIAGSMRQMDEVVDNLFMVLNTTTLPNLDGMDAVVKESLNMVITAEGLSLHDKRMHLDMLLMRYEVFLKKMFYMINGKELANRDANKGATLSDAVFAFDSLRKLKYDHRPEYQEFFRRLELVRNLRNDEAHSSAGVTEQEVDLAISMIIDMYLYSVGTNIFELEYAGYFADDARKPVIILDADYQSREDKNRFIPLYSIKAACGEFSDLNEVEREGWVDISHASISPDPKRYFVVKAVGESMAPKINDGDLCVFEWYKGGSRNGEIVLTECNEHDTDYKGSYTIKKYYSEKVTESDGSWRHTKVELRSINPEYGTISWKEDESTQYVTRGIFKCVIK